MEHAVVEERIRYALKILYQNDAFLLENRASEWSITHKFAEYLQQEFLKYHVDCEYNRMGWDGPKVLSGLPECDTTDEEKPEDRERKILPDILIHERGSNHRNLLAIEVKLSDSSNYACDRAKLRELTSNSHDFRYIYGLFALIPVDLGFENRKTCLEWFQDGREEPFSISCQSI